MKLVRACMVLLSLTMLSACFLTPGKFTSTLDIRADRSFTFTYQGEVIALNMDNLTKGLNSNDVPDKEAPATGKDTAYIPIAQNKGVTSPKAAPIDKQQDKEAKLIAIAAALSKEKGFRSAKYVGHDKFLIDYAITSRLDHSFLFPFNTDAQAIFPFVAIEVRADGRVRVQAPGFANENGKASPGGMGAPGMEDRSKDLDGTFTLTTDAEIVSQNQEDGAVSIPRGKQIVWKVTPLTQVAPMAILRFPASGK